MRFLSTIFSRRRIAAIRIGAGICCLLILGMAVVAVLVGKMVTVQPDVDVQVQSDGSVQQNGKTLGYLFPNKDGLLLSLPVKSDQQVVDDYYLITLPGNADVAQGQVVSIQDNSSMSVTTVSSNQLQVTAPSVVADSHTVVNVQLPAGMASAPWWRSLQAGLLNMSGWTWFALALLCAALSSFGGIKRIKYRPNRSLASRAEPPEGISPFEAAVLFKGYIDAGDITALLIDLAERGYLEIIERTDALFLLRYRTDDVGLSMFELYVLEMLVKGSEPHRLVDVVAELDRTLFSHSVGELYRQVYGRLLNRNFVSMDPRYIHLWYKSFGIIVQVLAIVGTAAIAVQAGLGFTSPLWFGFSAYLAGFAIYYSSNGMIPLSETGLAVRAELDAFNNYLSDLSLPRFAEANTDLFFKYYPYAMVMGVGDIWRRRFTPDSFYLPKWFVSLASQVVTPEDFVDRAATMTGILATRMEKAKDPNVD